MTATPVPTKLKLLRGNPAHRRIRPEPMPQVSATVPEPPTFLPDLARAEWYRVCPELHRLGLLTGVDIMPLAAYCWAYACWREALEVVTEEGFTITNQTGNVVQHPAAISARRAAADMLDYASQFGLTPVSRTKISAGVCQAPNKFEGMIAQ